MVVSLRGMIRSLILCFFALTIGQLTFGQTTRGSLLLSSHPIEVDSFQTNDYINLHYLRTVTDFLTNADVTHWNGFLIPKRKKAFVRHIKHLSELLERRFQEKLTVDNSVYELFYELALFKASLIQSAVENSSGPMSFKRQVKLIKESKKSKRVFRYRKIEMTDAEFDDPADSPFWHAIASPEKRVERFDELAKEKKIKAKKNMVVLFDELSYEGSAPKIKSLDLDLDNEWSLKWGDEVHTDVLGSRIFAALGYDVDHPYYYGEDALTLVFDGSRSVKNYAQLRDSIYAIYKMDLNPFVSTHGKISEAMADENKKLKPFVGLEFARFKKCAIEGRPDRVKRIGSFVPDQLQNLQRKELRAALLVHAFIGNWDTREENTLLTTVHEGNYKYHISAVFSDLGTSFGVAVNYFPGDFKVGLVNEFPWEVATIHKNEVRLNNPINSILKPYEMASYSDLHWMATKIAELTDSMLLDMIAETGWPKPIATLYFHKMASRRASILNAFQIEDKHPIPFDKELTVSENGVVIIEKGKLVREYDLSRHPESFLSTKGRTRNYGY